MGSRLRLASIAALAAVLFVIVSPELKYVSPESLAAQHPTNAQISEALTCQCGCGLTVANCNMPTCGFSVPLRAEIDTMIGKGMTRAAIIASFRHKYGEKILSAPTTEGFNLLAWLMPFAALAVGGGLMALAIGRWRSAGAHPAPAPADAVSAPPLDAEMRRRLESELQEELKEGL